MAKETIRDKSQRLLYERQKRVKISIGNAERRPGVQQEELENLQAKLDVIDYLITLVNKEDA